MKIPHARPNSLLPCQLDPNPATETLTAFGGLPLVAQTYRSLGLPQSVARHLRLKQRQRGLDEGDRKGTGSLAIQHLAWLIAHHSSFADASPSPNLISMQLHPPISDGNIRVTVYD